LCALGVLAKESALVVALAAPLEVALFGPSLQGPKRRRRELAFACLPALAALALGLGARLAVLGPALLSLQTVAVQQNPLAGASLGVRLANVPILFLFYARNLVWPV